MKRPLFLLVVELSIVLPLLIAYGRPAKEREVILEPPAETPSFTFGEVEDARAPRAPGAVTVDVAVGSGGNNFSPNTSSIVAGDTVRWTWAGSNHTVTSGTNCTANNQYCSPSNAANCSTAVVSNSGAVYSHTFSTAGTFGYFCRIHCGGGMTGWWWWRRSRRLIP